MRRVHSSLFDLPVGGLHHTYSSQLKIYFSSLVGMLNHWGKVEGQPLESLYAVEHEIVYTGANEKLRWTELLNCCVIKSW